ncbi:hypothetical protein [Thermophilibacter sp.]|uniref:hypothetical protein n=1 Tax=Thermophilibacter sp. TaxID=2847309 RepID=UPI003A92F347
MDWSRLPLMVLLIFVGIVAVVAVGGIAIGLLARRSARRDAVRDAAAGGDPARREGLSGDPPTIACPSCGATVNAATERCPMCDALIPHDSRS